MTFNMILLLHWPALSLRLLYVSDLTLYQQMFGIKGVRLWRKEGMFSVPWLPHTLLVKGEPVSISINT